MVNFENVRKLFLGVSMSGNDKSVWDDDLFGRETAAKDLEKYIQSCFDAGSFAGEQRSQVISVDAEYGIGKTFFLRRLAKQLEGSHPVAYIDAWTDDIAGQPIISLAATLKHVFNSKSKNTNYSARWDEFARKTGQIALIGGKGLGKQALKFALSGGAVEGIEAVLNSDGTAESIDEAVSQTVDDIYEAKLSVSNELAAKRHLETEIEQFEIARSAIGQVRSALSNFALEATSDGRKLPAFIIVDELDRCRPHYAVEFLEEVKHLFSVPEVYFILGINSRQLVHSISHSYGVGFEGDKYLDRFIDRSYVLPFPDLSVLVEKLYNETVYKEKDNLWFPDIGLIDGSRALKPAEWIARLLQFYSISPRRVFRYFDRLRTALALIDHQAVPMNYLCELIALQMGESSKESPSWRFYVPGRYGGKGVWYDGSSLFDKMTNVYTLPRKEMERSLQADNHLTSLLWDFVGNAQRGGAETYKNVLRRLAPFHSSSSGQI